MATTLAPSEIGTWEWEVATEAVNWSDSLWAMSGLDREHFVLTHTNLLATLDAVDAPRMAAAIEAAIRDDAPFHIETHRTRPDGSHAIVLSHGRVERDATGKALRMVGVDIDVTHLKHVEANLADSEAQFSTAFESAVFGMALVRPDGAWLKVNRALCEMLGYSSSEMLSTTFQALTHPDDLAMSLDDMARLHAGEIAQIRQKKRYRTRDGHYLWALTNVALLRDAQGLPHQHVTLIQNIDAQVKAETALQAAEQKAKEREREKSLLLDRLNEAQSIARIGSWSYDLATRQVWWSDEIYRIFAVDPATHVPSIRNNAAYFHPEDRERYHQQLNAAVRAGQSFALDVRLVAGDGTVKYIKDQGHLEFDDAGKVIRVYGTSQDVTSQHLLEAQLREAQKMESLGNLAGGVAHDFNNLLSAILGNVYLARLKLADPAHLLEKLEQIEQAGQRAKTLVDQILAFSRRQPLSFTLVEPGAVVTDAMALLRASISTGVEIACTVACTLPRIWADASQLQQVVINLVTNAWYAVRDLADRTPRVGVSLAPVHLDALAAGQLGKELPSGDYICLTVEDNGVGMTAATQARIFEPFFTTRGTGEGTGLGLAVVYGIVSAHHGAIKVESTPQVGSCFSVYLPAAREDGAAPRLSPLDEPGAVRLNASVMYIDDETALTMLVSELLGELGLRVTPESDPEHALARLARAPLDFDLVISDYNMPVHSGLDVARKVRQLRPDLPVVVSSGYITNELQQALDIGVIAGLINKVDMVKTLPALIASLLGKPPA